MTRILLFLINAVVWSILFINFGWVGVFCYFCGGLTVGFMFTIFNGEQKR